MIFEPETVKGFRDFLPPESLKRDAVKKIVEKWFRLYGFMPVDTAMVEFDELMKPDNLPNEEEDEAISDRFRLQDKGGRKLGLRYEFTFQLARIFRENPNIKLPFKRYQIGEVFRDEPVSARRFRQFTQCDADIIGDQTINADAECLALFSDILKELKVNFEIQINNRKLLNSIIESVEIRQIKNVMKEVDKIDKIGVDEVKNNLKKYADTNQIITLLKLLEKDIKFFKENAFSGIDELEELIEDCKLYGISLKFNPLLTRGFGYYTGNIFEIVEKGKKDSIAGGGRYDRTVGKYAGKEIPAVGISFGLERLTESANVKIENLPQALLISINQDVISADLAKKLRKAGVSCSIEFGKPSKGLDYANSLKIPFVVFIGEEEVGNKKFKLRNMETGKEELLSEKQLIRVLS
ncbi:histidine--tRNA ligase [Candidatus Pacearchaeota archaeon]|nr:histidine--tRNA ligase [Candidatus Pacearchaeota archaeon]